MTPAVGYTEMRDSGIEWVGKIPKEWKVTRMKTILQNVSEKNHPDATVLSLYRDLGVVPKNSRDDNHNVTSEDTSNYKFVRCGDLVINKMKAWQGSLAVSEFEGIVSPAYYVCKFISNSTDKKYLHYLLRCRPYAQEFERLSTGMRVGQWDLGIDDFLRIPVICPSISEQTAIAAYLDTQCAKIDEIIAEAKASIEDYKQWKASIIYEAVTKGLDPNAEMRDSGIEWIGKIPAGWRTFRLKNLGKARNGLTYSPENQVPEQKGTLVLRSSNIQNGVLDFSDNVYVDSNIPSELILEAGDILICSRNGSGKLIGKNAYIDVSGKYSFGAFMMSFRPVIHNTRYAYWILNSGVFNYYLPMFFTSTINQLTRENFRNMVIPYCDDKQIQKSIVEYLDKKVSQIDSVIKAKENFIFDLEAYKKSLIYEVVTGKRRVC